MCGIFTYIKKGKITDDEINGCLFQSKLLKHRGPDSFGSIVKDNIFFSLNRLSINDLSVNGNQPFTFEKYILVFNGEIYNFKYLKKKLLEKNIIFKSESDTEVLLHILINYGSEGLKLVNGMFSFIFYDGEKIMCSSDIFGEKTLYYYQDDKKIIFSSELIGLSNYTTKDFNEDKLFSYFSFGHLIDEQTFYKKVKKILPGEVLIIDKDLKINTFKYFSITDHYKSNKNKNIVTKEDLIELDDILTKNFQNKCIGDRGKTLLFSGGLDSFVVSKYLKDKENINFIFFDDKRTNLDPNIQNYFNNRIYIESIKESNFLPSNIIKIFGQPHHSYSSLAYQAMCAKINVTKNCIALSGLGGDEIFMGYNKFFDKKKNFLSRIKFFVKEKLSKLDKKILYLLSKNDSVFCLLQHPKYFNWLHDKFLKKYNEFSQLEKLYFSEIEVFMPSSRCVVLDHSSMSQGVEMRSCFLDIDILKWILNFDLEIIQSLGPKKILLNLLSEKEKNFFVNYKKKPFSQFSKKLIDNRAVTNNIYDPINSIFKLKSHPKKSIKLKNYEQLQILSEFV
tara:strand:+ start:2158 stop:3843 length:1686 start_codon:yes stop_codon:yes gene_type:complete